MNRFDPGRPSTSRGRDGAENEETVRDVFGFDSLEDYIKPGYDAIRDAVISANSLPEGVERECYEKKDDFKKVMKKEANRILDVMQLVANVVGKGRKLCECADEEKSESVVDLNDSLLDRSTLNMDVLEGIREEVGETAAAGAALSGSWNRPPPPPPPHAASHSPHRHNRATPTLHTAKLNIRPQILFKDKVDNSNTPWVPRIKEKPNAIKPLAILVECNDEGEECYSHPYEFELDRWTPSQERLKYVKAIKPKPMAETPFLYVKTEEDLASMLEELKNHTEMAVDLEHHSYRSFMGFTCLMQISTREKDYIVDTLALRSELHVLNQVFTKPTVLKVFHGAENDIEWLQRDLSLYVVNMFDTHQAAKLLDFPRLNLAHLLSHYCTIDANKHFQLYDWRTRPLSEGAVSYAREDTHYLLYIYSTMNNELIKKAQGNTNLLESVYKRSTQVCKRRYMKPIRDEDSHMLLYRKGKRMFDNRQLYALKELYRWRDRSAREMDESIGYVLPTHMMMQIAENLPREVQGILACCNPIPPVLRQSLHELHYIILAAREQPLVKRIEECGSVVGGERRERGEKWGSQEPLRDDLPTLLGTGLPPPPPLPRVDPQIPLFLDHDHENSKKIMRRLLEIENKKYLNPYQRYKSVIPYANQMEKEQREAEEREYEAAKKREKQKESERNESVLKEEVIKLEGGDRSFPLSKRASAASALDQKVVKKRKHVNGVERRNQVKVEGRGGGGGGGGGEGAEEGEGEGEGLKRPEKRTAVLNLEINTVEYRNSRPSSNQGRDKQPFVPYNYKDVDFEKFHSGTDNLKVSDNQFKHKGKRKQQFGGKNFSLKSKRGRR